LTNTVKEKKKKELKKKHKNKEKYIIVGGRGYGNVKETKKNTVIRNMKQKMQRNEKQIGCISWYSTCKKMVT